MNPNINKIDLLSNNSLDLSKEYWDEERNEKPKFRFDLGLELISKDNKALKELAEFKQLLNRYPNLVKESSDILSIACGNCWLEFNVLSSKKYNSFTGIDFSYHRVHKYAEIAASKIIQNCNVIDLIYGDFFNFNSEKKFDVIILSKAFHHFDEPLRLLRKLNSMLSEDGIIFIMGENYFLRRVRFYKFLAHFPKLILRKSYRDVSSLFPSYNDLFPPSYTKGDINYSYRDYCDLFTRSLFKHERFIFKEKPSTQAFILKK